MKYIVSACLLGDNCKYNGENNYDENVFKFLENKEFIKVCPECLGGLSIPRIPSEICGDKVINKDGIDVTLEYNLGAKKTLKIAKENNCTCAIFKSRSPSCGCGEIYDGTFSKTIKNGDGITTKLLKENKIKVITNEQIELLKEGVL